MASMTPELSRSAAVRQIPAWVAAVGPGWAAMLDQLHHGLLALDADYRIESFGTKFGSLGINVADRFIEDKFDGKFTDRATR